MPNLIWSGKNETAAPQGSLCPYTSIYPNGEGYPNQTLNHRLIYGDNLAIMAALLPEYEDKLSLIYADPPFFTNRKYSARVGQGEDSRRPQDWQLAEGYPDDWENIDAYLNMLYPRLQLMHRLLSEQGSLYLHLDWHANHYARLLLDEIFGPDRLVNEIVWVYHGPSPIRSAFNRKHDTILVYSKSDNYIFNVDDVREPYNPNTVKTFKSSRKAGFGKVPDLKRGKVPEDWWYFPVVARLHQERTGYPTQKPEALLERILRASSNPNDLVADFFCGSGTTLAVADQLDRRFIGSDVMWRAVYTTSARLVSSQSRPFLVERECSASLPRLTAHGETVLRNMGDGWIELEAENLGQIYYWEIDPRWNGKTFRSAAQSIRPRKKGTVASRLQLPEEISLEEGRGRVIYQDGAVSELSIKH